MKKVLQIKEKRQGQEGKGSGGEGFADMWGDESGQQDSAHPRTDSHRTEYCKRARGLRTQF